MSKQFDRIKPPKFNDSEVTRAVAAWENEITHLALGHLADTDWLLDDLEAAREGIEFAYVDEIGTVEVLTDEFAGLVLA